MESLPDYDAYKLATPPEYEREVADEHDDELTALQRAIDIRTARAARLAAAFAARPSERLACTVRWAEARARAARRALEVAIDDRSEE